MTRLFVLLFFLLFSSKGYTLTLHEAFEKALTENPQILSQEQALKAAIENVKQAKADFWPTLDGTASVGRRVIDLESGSDQKSTPKSVGLSSSWTLYKGGELRAAKNEQEANLKAAEATLVQEKQSIFYSIVQAYANVLHQLKVLDLNENQVSLLLDQKAETDLRFEVGEVTKTDVQQAKARLATAKAAEAEARGNLSIARAALRALLLEEGMNLTWPQVPEAEIPDTLTEIKQVARRQNPEIQVAHAGIEAAKFALRGQRAGYLPTLSADGSFVHNKDTYGSTGSTDDNTTNATLSLNLPLFRGGKTVSNVREGLALVKQAEMDEEEVIRKIEEEAVQAWSAWTVAQANANSFTEGVEATTLALEGVQKEAEAGERTTLDVLDARQELLAAQVDLARAKRDQLVAAYRILKVTGQLNPLQ